MPPKGHAHRPGGPTCNLPTKRACDDRQADWEAMQQVILAYNVVETGGVDRYRKDHTVFAQLVRYIAGTQDDMINDDGNSSRAPWVLRLRAAIERVKAGDLPANNLYEPVNGREA